MSHAFVLRGASNSFPGEEAASHPLARAASGDLTQAVSGDLGAAAADKVLILAGDGAGEVFRTIGEPGAWRAVVIELGNECLGAHTGEERGQEGSNVIGFARFRMGKAAPSPLVELVRQPRTDEGALQAARAVFEQAGLVIAVCNDFPGRIVNRLIRPYLNAVLRRLDERLASADDMDTTLRLGLGYPEGPISLLHRTGLAEHHAVTQALHQALGDAAYAPARRAQVAHAVAQSRRSGPER